MTIATQFEVSTIPWCLYGNWVIFVITAAGTLFDLLTGNLREWQLEKWPGMQLNEPKQETAHVTDQTPSSAAVSNTPTSVENDLERCGSGLSPSTAKDQPTATKLNSKADQKCRCTIKPNKVKTVCLTRGNGRQCVMVIICSGTTWNLETLSTATSSS
ncbi:hypothetical protein BKA56DRAFT_348528 [Ilyonectria sp. MPI-CAGE-AT-0026]|nr:hypothetical protein BKA56DRAFT_348528 [Ilyonectria sp. MPI-CAGE-AT-0026]